jgi:cytochrome c553
MRKILIITVAGLLSGNLLCGSALAAEGNAEAAKAKVSMCQGCHGIYDYKATFPRVYRVPMIAGQQPGYIVKALEAYKSGARTQPNMKAIADGLSDQDIADLAAYYGGAK